MQISGRLIDVPTALEALGLELGQEVNSNFLTHCPWPANHKTGEDAHPSFSAHSETGAWICYAGCGYGHLVSLVARLRDLSEDGAKKWLLREAGGFVAFDKVKSALPGASPIALDDESYKVAQADYALMRGDTTSSYFLNRGFTWGTIDEWGIKYDQGLPAIVIPVWDWAESAIVGVVRRLVPPQRQGLPKYLYTNGFDRSKHLFGAHKCRDVESPIVVVEGPLDAIWLHQLGYFAVALMGAYCSRQQVRILQALTRRVVLALDNDLAGREATERLVEQLKGKFMLAVAPEYSGKDVQDLEQSELDRVLGEAGFAWRGQ